MTVQLTAHTITVLLVDDSPIVGEAVRRMLAPEQDIVFHYCADPARALPMANELHPTIILQDLVMPEIDGITLLKFYRGNPATADVPVIVLSSKEEATTKAEAFACGASDYLVKLPDRIEVVARIRHHSRGYINLLQRNEAFNALRVSQDRLAQELAEAAEYVKELLTKPWTEGPITVDWRFVPSVELGGDSFHYEWVDDNHCVLSLLDVCGHGVGAALLSISVVNVLRTQAGTPEFLDPARALSFLNETFLMEKHNNMYFTMWYGVYDKRTRTLRYASGGHPPALLLVDGAVTELGTPGLIIGGMPGSEFVTAERVMPPGALLYLFSDGVYEIHSPAPEERLYTLAEFGAELAGAPATGSRIDHMLKFVRDYGKSEMLPDDFTMAEFRIS